MSEDRSRPLVRPSGRDPGRLHPPRGDADPGLLAGLPWSRLGAARGLGGRRPHGHPRHRAPRLLAGASRDGGGAPHRRADHRPHRGRLGRGPRQQAGDRRGMHGRPCRRAPLARRGLRLLDGGRLRAAPRPLVGHARTPDGGDPSRLLRERRLRHDLRGLVDGHDAGHGGGTSGGRDPRRPHRHLPAGIHGARAPRLRGIRLLPAREAAAAAGRPGRRSRAGAAAP